MLKQFTILKTGYSAGVYGNSGEYYSLIVNTSKENFSLRFWGQYGADYRVAEVLKNKGFKQYYTAYNYGKMSSREAQRLHMTEREAIKSLKDKFKSFKEVNRDRTL